LDLLHILFVKYFNKTVIIILLFILPIFLISTLSYLFPFFGFIFMTLSMILLLPITFPFKISKSFASFRSNLIDHLLTFLYNIKVIAFAATFSIIVFCQPKKTFKYCLFIGGLLTVLYSLVSRWYYFNTIVKHETLTDLNASMVYIILFVGLFLIYLRVLISLSFLILNTTFLRRPELLPDSVVFVLTGDENPFRDHPSELKPQYPRPNVPRPISFINFDNSKHYYRTYVENMPQNGKIFRYVGIGVGVVGVGAAVYAAHQTGVQTRIAERNADATCVQAGVMTKEEFKIKWNSKTN
jgi:hypothetical protein